MFNRDMNTDNGGARAPLGRLNTNAMALPPPSNSGAHAGKAVQSHQFKENQTNHSGTTIKSGGIDSTNVNNDDAMQMKMMMTTSRKMSLRSHTRREEEHTHTHNQHTVSLVMLLDEALPLQMPVMTQLRVRQLQRNQAARRDLLRAFYNRSLRNNNSSNDNSTSPAFWSGANWNAARIDAPESVLRNMGDPTPQQMFELVFGGATHATQMTSLRSGNNKSSSEQLNIHYHVITNNKAAISDQQQQQQDDATAMQQDGATAAATGSYAIDWNEKLCADASLWHDCRTALFDSVQDSQLRGGARGSTHFHAVLAPPSPSRRDCATTSTSKTTIASLPDSSPHRYLSDRQWQNARRRRCDLVLCLIELHAEFSLTNETLHLAVQLLDRYLLAVAAPTRGGAAGGGEANQRVRRRSSGRQSRSRSGSNGSGGGGDDAMSCLLDDTQTQLLVLASLFVASKCQEVYPISVSDLCDHFDELRRANPPCSPPPPPSYSRRNLQLDAEVTQEERGGEAARGSPFATAFSYVTSSSSSSSSSSSRSNSPSIILRVDEQDVFEFEVKMMSALRFELGTPGSVCVLREFAFMAADSDPDAIVRGKHGPSKHSVTMTSNEDSRNMDAESLEQQQQADSDESSPSSVTSIDDLQQQPPQQHPLDVVEATPSRKELEVLVEGFAPDHYSYNMGKFLLELAITQHELAAVPADWLAAAVFLLGVLLVRVPPRNTGNNTAGNSIINNSDSYGYNIFASKPPRPNAAANAEMQRIARYLQFYWTPSLRCISGLCASNVKPLIFRLAGLVKRVMLFHDVEETHKFSYLFNKYADSEIDSILDAQYDLLQLFAAHDVMKQQSVLY